MKSMTGFGCAEASLRQGALSVEVRAVNSRHLDVRLRLPTELGDHAAPAEDVARKLLVRGRVELIARLSETAEAELVLHKRRAATAVELLRSLREELALQEPVPLTLLGCVPELFSFRSRHQPGELREALALATESACQQVATMREREGRSLQQDISARVRAVCEHISELSSSSDKVVHAYREKLRARLERLTAQSVVEVDPTRIEHEIALFADRCDISEELTRLQAHCAHFAELVESGTDQIGRKLDFLLQEMGREANTVGAKGSDAQMAQRVVELKAELERVREQVQNVL